MSMNGTIRVLCVDDHGLLAEGLRVRLGAERDFEVVGWLPDADRLLEEARRLEPDLVLMDVEMPGSDPFEVTTDLRRARPSVKVVMLTAHVRDHYMSAAFKAGVSGYFSKTDDLGVLVDGLRRIARGDFVLGPSVSERARPLRLRSRERFTADSMSAKIDGLTGREQEILLPDRSGTVAARDREDALAEPEDRRRSPREADGEARHPQHDRARPVRDPRGPRRGVRSPPIPRLTED